jgi:predicted component of type VI protein secretion system
MFRADGQRRSFSIVREITMIGRREDCDLRIPLGDVSRKHCRLIKDEQTVRIEDLGSSNGTFHNDQKVQEAVLSPGDTIRIGPVTFMVQIDGVPADEDIQAAAAAPESAAPAEQPAHNTAESAQAGTAADGSSEHDELSAFFGEDPSSGEQVQQTQPEEPAPARNASSSDLAIPMADEEPS